MDERLTPYWIRTPDPTGPIGFGVTAFTLEDALNLIEGFGYGRYLPDDRGSLLVKEQVLATDLDASHVVPNMGPMSSRGLWYPFVALGVPGWVAEAMKSTRGN
jgi:hypothetical protein